MTNIWRPKSEKKEGRGGTYENGTIKSFANKGTGKQSEER
jgi:hypothetical protein